MYKNNVLQILFQNADSPLLEFKDGNESGQIQDVANDIVHILQNNARAQFRSFFADAQKEPEAAGSDIFQLRAVDRKSVV